MAAVDELGLSGQHNSLPRWKNHKLSLLTDLAFADAYPNFMRYNFVPDGIT